MPEDDGGGGVEALHDRFRNGREEELEDEGVGEKGRTLRDLGGEGSRSVREEKTGGSRGK